MSYGITGWTPGGGRQSLTYSLKASQKRGMGRANIVSNNIFINNYAPMPMGKTIAVECCNSDRGMSFLEKLVLGLGAGLALLGTIFGAGGGGAPAEGAGDSGQKAEDTIEEKTEPKPQISEKQQKENAEIAEQKAKAADFINGQITKAKDSVLGSKADISGTVTVGENGEVSIKDQQNTYTYQKTGRTVNYKGTEYPVYTLTGATNNTTGKEVPTTTQEYILMNGELVQPSDCSELAGLGTGSVQKNNPTATTYVKAKVNQDRNTGVPFQQLSSYASINDPSVRGNAKHVDEAINKLPENKRGAYKSQLEQIIKDFGNSNDFGAKMTTNSKLTALLNSIEQAQGTNTTSPQTKASSTNKPFIGSRQPWL